MKRFRVWAFLLSLLCVGSSRVSASDALSPEISALQNKLLAVRGFYRTAELHYHADGTPEGSPEKGFGPSDALIHIAEIKASSHRLTFTGDQPLIYYDAANDKLSFRPGWLQRRVTIDLPPNADEAAAEQAVWTAFYKPTEPVLPGCSAYDKESRKTLLLHTEQLGTKKHYPATGLCLPFGERVLNQVGENALPPKALSTPDPAMPKDAPRDPNLKAVVVLGLIVDAAGHPESIMVLKSQSYSFDLSAAQAVSTWKFKPATHDDQPVPVFISVEVNYHWR